MQIEVGEMELGETNKIQELYTQALNLCQDCHGLKSIAGSGKLSRKCLSELEFLSKVSLCIFSFLRL